MKKRKLIFRLLLAVFVVSASVTLYSCYPNGSTNPVDYDVYISLHKTDLNGYKNYRTYIMRDSVAHINDGSASGSIVTAYDQIILQGTVANLSSLGYTRLTNLADTAIADLIISTAITNSTTYYVDYYYPGGYWGYGYGYYYPYATTYSVTTGSVFIAMIDKKTYQPNTNPTVVWMGILNGVSTGETGSTSTRITDGINKVFSQSPYLKVN